MMTLVIQGPRPTDEDQKLWAPLLYFTHAVAGNMVAMMHKLGMFKLRIGYGVKKVSDMLYNYETTYLACIIEDGALADVSRYYEAVQCRMVAETVLRATFSSMMVHDDLDDAMIYAMQSVTHNAVDLSLLPVLHERFLQRMIRYELLLGMSTLCLMLRVPVVSMTSILQLMNGCAVSDPQDAEAMRQFLLQCVEQQDGLQMVKYLGLDEFSNHMGGRFPGYITCTQLKEICASSMMQPQQQGGQQQQHRGGSGGGGNASNGVPMEPIMSVVKRIYSTHQKTLSNCAFVKDLFGFQRCILALMHAYDLRKFFGGTHRSFANMLCVNYVSVPESSVRFAQACSATTTARPWRARWACRSLMLSSASSWRIPWTGASPTPSCSPRS